VGAHFLIIDDEPAICELYRKYLELLGHTATEAYSSQHARDQLLYHRPAAVLLDIMLPDMSGLDLCRELRQHPAVQDRPIIVISAYSPPLIAEAERAGANHYLSKPLKLQTLKALLNDLGL